MYNHKLETFLPFSLGLCGHHIWMPHRTYHSHIFILHPYSFPSPRITLNHYGQTLCGRLTSLTVPLDRRALGSLPSKVNGETTFIRVDPPITCRRIMFALHEAYSNCVPTHFCNRSTSPSTRMRLLERKLSWSHHIQYTDTNSLRVFRDVQPCYPPSNPPSSSLISSLSDSSHIDTYHRANNHPIHPSHLHTSCTLKHVNTTFQ